MVAGEGLFRVMTWNIHGAVGLNPRFDLSRVVELVGRWAPDVVALQEVDSRRRDPAIGDPFEFLQGKLGGYGVGAKAIQTTDGEYGQMLVSGAPMRDVEVFDVSWPECEPRRVIRALVDTSSGPLRVVSTHLGLSLRERGSQAQKLLEIVGATQEPAVLMGDFNDWLWVGSVRRVLAAAMPERTRHRTFPSILPLLYLDRIYCRPKGMLVRSFVDRDARHVSDHLAVIADLRF